MPIRLFILSFCLCAKGFSAGPLLHIWTAERFCSLYHIPPDQVIDLLVGTEFPDIRYITALSRESTHPHVTCIQNVSDTQSHFRKGVKLHAWLDKIRESFIPDEIYQAIAVYSEGYCSTFLKFLEEEILSDFYDARRWSFCFACPLEEELELARYESVTKWHEMLKWAFAASPSMLLWAQSYRGSAFGVPSGILYRWSFLLPELKEDPLFREYCMKLLEHIETELKGKSS